jgi:ectoine hydroxylase-related dioxygenase (phytanoyl-CoA dioxygenase family)
MTHQAYRLTAAKIREFRQNGHVLLRQVCSREEVDTYRPIIAAEVERRKDQARGGVYQKALPDRGTREKAFLQLENLWPDSPDIARFSRARRFGQIAADLFGVDAVRIYHDQALFKEPGGGYTPWHQDQFYWPLDTPNTVTMWLPLVDTGSEMGTLVFASGVHREGPLANVAISDHSEEVFKRVIKERDAPLAIGELNAGDATWHYGWTPHKAPGNATDQMRQIMTVIFFADGARVIESQNEKQPSDLAKWLPGCRPGDLAASPLNPLVFNRPHHPSSGP